MAWEEPFEPPSAAGGGTMSDADILAAVKRVDGAGSGLDADVLDGVDSTGFAPAGHVGSRDGHPVATLTLDGFESAADKTKLDGIQTGAQVNPTAAQIRNAILLGTDTFTAAGSLAVFDAGLSYMYASSTATGWPLEATPFHVEIFKVNGTSGKQKATQTTTKREWARYWMGTAWSAWEETTGILQSEADARYAGIDHVNSTAGHPLATPSADGFMGSADKSKLDSISPGHRNLKIKTTQTANDTTAYVNVIELGISVVAGTAYRFYALILFSAVGTTGSRWALNGPAFTRLAYTSRWSTGADTLQTAVRRAYDPAIPVSATSLDGENFAIIEGIVLPSANGTLIPRFASEVAGSAVTALVGSTIEWW